MATAGNAPRKPARRETLWRSFGRLRVPLGPQTSMILLAVIIGLAGGVGAIGFRWLNAYNKEILKVDLAGSISSRLDDATRMRTWETVGGYELAELEAPAHLIGKPLRTLRMRQQWGVQIILIERAGKGDDHSDGDDRYTFPDPETTLEPGDPIVVFSKHDDIARLARDAD